MSNLKNSQNLFKNKSILFSIFSDLYQNQNIRNNNEINLEYYNQIKEFNGQKYSGMKVSGIHRWKYNNGIWIEQKISPDEWKINFNCRKTRLNIAPKNSGAENNSQFHWLIVADQKAIKIDENNYDTYMQGIKFKVGYKKPSWQKWSYEYADQKLYKEKIIEFLEKILKKLRNE